MTADDLVLTPRGLRFQGRIYPCSIGRSGLTDRKREGDGATPRGVQRIIGCLYRPDRLSKPCDWALPIRPGDIWSDDPQDENYNRMTRTPTPHSHEPLRRADPLYDIVLITDWNWPRSTPGHGSAIFLHQWRKPGYRTAGCIALRRDHIAHIAAHIRYRTRLIV